MPHFEMQSKMPVSSHDLFAWHERGGALERLTPPWESVKVLRKDPGLKPGSEVHLQTRIGPLRVTWVARHVDYTAGKEFTDIQVSGPFAKWKHRHQMIPNGKQQSILKDEIDYELRLGLGKAKALSTIKRMFTYRHSIQQHDLEVQANHPSSPLKIAITGASGLVGRELSAFLRTAGHSVLPVVRDAAGEGEIFWDLELEEIEKEKLEGVDAVIHLAGENIGSGRWTAAKKDRIRNSRIIGTRTLVNALNQLKQPPKVLISTSAVGYYGAQGGAGLDESAGSGTDFLAQVCVDWEAEARKFTGGRVVTPRFGVVLSPRGGALEKMLLPFQAGIGGRVGSGKQLMSWIAIDDLIYNLYRLMLNEAFSGPVNLTCPKAVTNQEFSEALAKVLHRPCFFPLPAFVLRLLFGEMADATMLSSVGTVPSALNREDARFYYPDLDSALRHLLGRQ